MKITCPGCQKQYNIDQAKLPSNVKSAKCKACGQLIDLDSVAAKFCGDQPAIVTVACADCGRKYNLRPDKVPPDTKSFNCKSCGHPVPLEPQGENTTVQPLRIETPNRLPDATAVPAARPQSGPQDIIRISCAGCGKKYKIARSKVPSNTTAVKCRVCGDKMILPQAAPVKAAGRLVQPEVQPAEAPAAPSDLQPAEYPPATPRKRRKKWLFAMAACIGLVALLGALAGRQTLRLDRLYQLFTAGKSRQGIESLQLAAIKPFLALNLNMPLVLNALEKRPAAGESMAQLQRMANLLGAMDLKQVELCLYSTPQNQILPVIIAHGSNRRQIEKFLNGQFNKYLTRETADSYHLSKEALQEVQKYSQFYRSYKVIFVKDGVALTPESLADIIRKTPKAIADSPIAGFARTIATPQDLGSLAFRIPADMSQGWEKNLQNLPAVQSIPQAAAIAGIGSAIVSRMADSLNSLELLALGFQFNGQNERLLTYAQQFKPGIDGEKIYRSLAAENPADPEIDPIISKLIELFQDRRYRHTLKFKDNRLEISFGWSAQDDEVFLTALTTATIGQLFAGSMELAPSQGTVATRYITNPSFVVAVDVDRLKNAIPHIIEDNLFPGNYWDSGDNPTMTLVLDTVDIPNAALAELAYEVQAIRTTDGKDVLQAEKNKFTPRLLPGSSFPGSISLNILKNTAPDTLGKAIIDFHLSVPVALETFNFKAGEKNASVSEVDGLRVTLNRIEKDVAKVSSSGGKLVRLIAYDQSGNALATKESKNTSSSAAARFQGVIDRLQVVVVRDMLEYPFEVEVDLNGGKELALTREPEIPARIRYDRQPLPAYVDFTAEDIQNLGVTWTEVQQDGWSDQLSIRLPKGPFSGNAVWEVHFFGENKPLVLAGNSAQSEQEVSYILDKGLLNQAAAAFGNVQLNLHSSINRLVFLKKEGMQSEIQRLPSGDEVWVSFNQNEISYSTGNAEVIQTAAHDARNNRLKEDPHTRSKASKQIVYFWGVPAKFSIDVSTTTLKKLVPFEFKMRPLDEKSYIAYRQLVENQHEVVKTIKAIDRARRSDRTYYGDDLAGLYYLYGQKEGSPMRLISQEVAQSDPAGQKRFGYNVKPYKGYYFTVLSGIETNGSPKSYNRRSRKSNFTWQNGTITTTALTRHPDLVAIPADDSQPTFFLQWGQVFMKPLNGEKLEYLPDGYYNEGWVEAKFIDD